jgi:hypothetical protein
VLFSRGLSYTTVAETAEVQQRYYCLLITGPLCTVLHSRLLRPPGHSSGSSSSSSAAAAAGGGAAAADSSAAGSSSSSNSGATEDNYSERTRQQIAQR